MRVLLSGAKYALLASTAMAMPTAAFAQENGTGDPDAATISDEVVEDENVIIVSGFRESLNAAVQAKREAVGQVDVIVAEDIGKHPLALKCIR